MKDTTILQFVLEPVRIFFTASNRFGFRLCFSSWAHKVGSLLCYLGFHLWGLIKDSSHSQIPYLYRRLLMTVNEAEEHCIISGSFI